MHFIESNELHLHTFTRKNCWLKYIFWVKTDKKPIIEKGFFHPALDFQLYQHLK